MKNKSIKTNKMTHASNFKTMKRTSTVQNLFLIIFMIIGGFAWAQEPFVIKGKVTDAETGESMIGVNIIEKNKNDRFLNGTVTDLNGNYMIEVKGGEETALVFSYISYKTETRPIKNGQTIVNVTMQSSAETLQDLVVEGQRLTSSGIEMISKRDMTGASSTVEMKDIEGIPANNVAEVLQGRVSGVLAIPFSGDPGSGIQVRVRGETSLSAGNDPLYVVDGMPVFSEKSNSLSEVESSPLSDIPPEDIESIEVLKDASAVALWGTRAANGVVVIKTKRGESNKTSVGFSTRLTFKMPKPGVPMLDGDDYKTLMNEADQHRGDDKYHEEVITNLRDNVENSDYEMHNNNTDWVDAIENYGFIQNYSFNLSGGGNAVRYRFSTSFDDNRGPIITTEQQKFNTSFNLNYSISTKTSMAANISYTNTNLSQKDIAGYSMQKTALMRAPTWPIYLQDENGMTLEGQYAYQSLLLPNDHSITNPYAFLLNKLNESLTNRLYGFVRVILRPVEHLRLQMDLGGDFSANKDYYFIPPTSTGEDPGEVLYNQMKLIDDDNFKVYSRFTANYNRDFNENHSLLATFFSSIDMTQKSMVSASANNIASFRTPTLSSAASFVGGTPLGEGFSETIITSTGGRLQYKFKDRYIISSSLNVDGSSRFGPDNRYAVLPTLSGKWIVSEESFIKNLDFVDELALRYSWGKNGNGNIGNYTFYSRYTSSSLNNYLGTGGIQSDNIRLDNIRWETTTQHNAGISAVLMRKKLEFDLYYFDKYTNDLLMSKSPIPTSSGYSNLLYYNSGDVRNNGWELEFKYRIFRNKNVTVSLGGNVSTLKNRVMKLPTLSATEGIDSKAGGYYWRIVEGDPLGSFYGYQYEGVYAYDADAVVRDEDGDIIYNLGGYDSDQPFNNAKIMQYKNKDFEGGDAIYTDINSDGVIDDLDVVKIGDVNPDLYGGFNSTVAYKDFSLNLFFMYSVGNDIINYARMDVENMYNLSNQSIAVNRRWRKQGDVTDIPKAAHNYKSRMNYLPSSRFIEDGSYLKLQSIQCSYFVPRKKLKRFNISSARVFFNSTNLLTWTHYSGQDPEVNGKGSKLRGVDKSLTAQPIMFTAGLSLKF